MCACVCVCDHAEISRDVQWFAATNPAGRDPDRNPAGGPTSPETRLSVEAQTDHKGQNLPRNIDFTGGKHLKGFARVQVRIRLRDKQPQQPSFLLRGTSLGLEQGPSLGLKRDFVCSIVKPLPQTFPWSQ